MSTIRRVFLYGANTIALSIFGSSVSRLLAQGLDLIPDSAADVIIGRAEYDLQYLSLSLAMFIISGPLWFFLWRVIRRNVAGNEAEIGSAIRKFFLNLVLVWTILVWLNNSVDSFGWLLGGAPVADLPSSGLATMVVAGLVWLYHWRVSEHEGQPSRAAATFRRWYVYIVSGWSLVAVAAAVVQLVYAAFFGLPVGEGTVIPVQLWNSAVQYGIASMVLGGLVWYLHWFRMARDDAGSTLRQVYLYLLAILGSAIAGLTALITFLYSFFIWAFSGFTLAADVADTGMTYLQFLGWTVPTVLVAGAIWSYHRQLALEEAGQVVERRLSAQRVQSYLMSFLSLSALISGMVILLGILLDIIIEQVGGSTGIAASGWWHSQLSMCLALLVVATPIWLYYWNRVLRQAATSGISEWKARSRRIYLYGFIGVSLASMLAALVNISYQLIKLILQGSNGGFLLGDTKWGLQSLIVALPVFLYHWRILQQERRMGAEKAAMRKRVTILASESMAPLVSQIQDGLGFRMDVLWQLVQAEDVPVLSDDELGQLVSRIKETPGTKVMLMISGGVINVVPYEEK